MSEQYKISNKLTSVAELRSQLPSQIRQAVVAVIEADPTSDFFYQLEMANQQINLYLIEQNSAEFFTVCHCFQTDYHDSSYTYVSMPLSDILMFTKMADELALT